MSTGVEAGVGVGVGVRVRVRVLYESNQEEKSSLAQIMTLSPIKDHALSVTGAHTKQLSAGHLPCT